MVEFAVGTLGGRAVEPGGDMLAAPARYVSVSELYSTDEVELLLDEIRELEPTSCRGEDVQDFEIAGSGLAGGASGAGGAEGAGGRSPCGTELTERSWDSHAHYSRAPPPRPRRVAPLYCRLTYLASPTGAGTFLLACVCVCVCGCVWGVAGLRVWALGGAAGGARLLLLAALSSALLHAALLLLHVTRLVDILPLDWRLMTLWSMSWSGVSLCAGAALSLAALLGSAEARAAPAHVLRPLLAAAGLALAGGLLALAAAGLCLRRCFLRLRPPPAAARRPAPRAAYRAVPAAPPAPSAAPAPPSAAAPQPSTSRAPPL